MHMKGPASCRVSVVRTCLTTRAGMEQHVHLTTVSSAACSGRTCQCCWQSQRPMVLLWCCWHYAGRRWLPGRFQGRPCALAASSEAAAPPHQADLEPPPAEGATVNRLVGLRSSSSNIARVVLLRPWPLDGQRSVYSTMDEQQSWPTHMRNVGRGTSLRVPFRKSSMLEL